MSSLERLWAEPLVTKQPDEVQRAFKQIIDRANVLLPPNRLTTDAGGEFASVKKYMERNRRLYRVRTSLRSLATLDNVIGLLKNSSSRPEENTDIRLGFKITESSEGTE